MITFSTAKHHWNYYLAIESDLENMSRYIEFSNNNLNTYSIELTHILLSASSEIDVIMKQLCLLLDSNSTVTNINDYKSVITTNISNFVNEEISIDRYGLVYKPWIDWLDQKNPDWWRSYNKVKHERNSHFHEANLKNAINAVGALLITAIYYYKYAFAQELGNDISFKETTRQLLPESSFLKINANYYYDTLIV